MALGDAPLHLQAIPLLWLRQKLSYLLKHLMPVLQVFLTLLQATAI